MSSRLVILLSFTNFIVLILVISLYLKAPSFEVLPNSISCNETESSQSYFTLNQSLNTDELAEKIVKLLPNTLKTKHSIESNVTKPEPEISKEEYDSAMMYIDQTLFSGGWTEDDNRYMNENFTHLTFKQISSLRSKIGDAINSGEISMDATPDF